MDEYQPEIRVNREQYCQFLTAKRQREALRILAHTDNPNFGLLEKGYVGGVTVSRQGWRDTTFMFWNEYRNTAEMSNIVACSKAPEIVVEKLSIDTPGFGPAELFKKVTLQKITTENDVIARAALDAGKTVKVVDMGLGYEVATSVIRSAPTHLVTALRRLGIDLGGMDQPIVLLNKLWQVWLDQNRRSVMPSDVDLDPEMLPTIGVKKEMALLADQYPGKIIPMFFSGKRIHSVLGDFQDGYSSYEAARDAAMGILISLFPEPRAYILKEDAVQLR